MIFGLGGNILLETYSKKLPNNFIFSGVLGTVQDPVVSRNSTVSITWNPPVGWADCDDLMYEIRWFDHADNTLFFTDTTSQTQYVFHYTAAEFLCQIFVIDIIAKYNNINGEIYNTIAVAGNATWL